MTPPEPSVRNAGEAGEEEPVAVAGGGDEAEAVAARAGDEAEVVAAARAGDGEAFALLAARHRADLRLHCYRMLGSLEEAEDVTQETLLRAWQAMGRYEGRAGVRTWLHRIATNACLDLLARQRRRRSLLAGGDPDAPPPVAVPWLQPYPDSLLDQAAAPADPAAAAVTRETVELAFVAALQFLPDAQRAALVLRDLLGWPAADCARLLGVSVPAVTSALQRARATLRQRLGRDRSRWRRGTALTREETETLNRYMRAIEAADHDAIAALLAPGARVSHQPGAGGHHGDAPVWYAGRETILHRWAPALAGTHAVRMRMLPTAANRQPAAATYVRVPGEPAFRPFSLSVVTVAGGRLTELAQFGPGLFPLFRLPASLEGQSP